jgi:hypothetical protein
MLHVRRKAGIVDGSPRACFAVQGTSAAGLQSSRPDP